MKKTFLTVSILFGISTVFSAFAQTSADPTITVQATDPNASESGPDPGAFTVTRTGPTNFSVLVFFRLGGTASNGVDYQTISNQTVAIPAGASSASVKITPIDDSLAEGNETVELQIVDSPMACMTCGYRIGWPSNAVVNIADNDRPATNRSLYVQINAPRNGDTFAAPADIALRAFATGGSDVKVEFFEGDNSLGFGVFVPTLCPAPYCPYYALMWSNVPPGQYTLTAHATDTDGTSAISDPVYIQVLDGVNIYATDPTATEVPPASTRPPDPAAFTVRRSETNGAITVFYNISGTASNGVDYAQLSGQVIIPDGSQSADIVVTPIDDNLAEGIENVVLTLVPPCPPCLFANPPCEVPQGENCYPIGPHNSATVYIRDDDVPQTNHPPYVRLDGPRDGDVFPPSSDIPLRAFTQDAEDGYNLTVEFFEGSHSLGFGTFQPTRCATCPYYSLTWSNVPPGRYTLTAKATDSAGASSISDPVHITVGELPPQPPFVNIYATDPNATEQPAVSAIPPDTATFTVQRSSETNYPLTVYYRISGTASNGGDYRRLSGNVTIPEGSFSADIVVDPIDDNLLEGTESVVLTIQPVCPSCLWAYPPCAMVQTTTCYQVGIDSEAVAYIHDNETNVPPVTAVSIIATDPVAVEGRFCRSNWWSTTSGSNGQWTVSSPTTTSPTNCFGTNMATFVVRRSGETNSNLTVYYTISGTASNGVDYRPLPGSVVIFAGRRSANINVIPIDDSIPEHIETVVLTLRQPPQTSPSPYEVGSSSCAEAIILDNDQPRPPCVRLADGTFHLCRPGTNGYNFTVRCSTDLLNWSVICTNTVNDGAVHYVDPDAAGSRARFYQVVPEPGYAPSD